MTARYTCRIASSALLIALSACSKDRSERVAASYSSATQPVSSSAPRVPSPQALGVGLDAIPIEEDYEQRAASTIDASNLKARLAELEKEMSL